MKTRTRNLLIAAAALLVALTALAWSPASRLFFVLGLFESPGIEANFRSMDQNLTARVVKAGQQPSEFVETPTPLPETYPWNGANRSTLEFLRHAGTTGLVVLKGNNLLYENYWQGNGPSTRSIAWSVSKSFLSALFGIAVAEGHILSLEQKVSEYVPALKDSGYGSVRIKDVLQMSSGIRFNEDYGDFDSDINVMGRFFAINLPLVDFIKGLKNNIVPGTVHHYVSMDTQVLGMILVAATGRDLTSYTEEKLWKPLGMEANASWLIDGAGMEAAFGGLNAVLRDYARLGRLYLNLGRWNGVQIVPEDWVKASVTPDAPHLAASDELALGAKIGYGYQWWVAPGHEGDFLAIGIYGQAIYVSPRTGVVIARTAAYHDYNTDGYDMELESIAFFRAVAEGMR